VADNIQIMSDNGVEATKKHFYLSSQKQTKEALGLGAGHAVVQAVEHHRICGDLILYQFINQFLVS
jgi:hypothetical protein